MLYAELSELIIGGAIEVHRVLGPGVLESVYEEALFYELEDRGVDVVRQALMPVEYKGRRIAVGFRADLIVADKVIIEIKSVERLNPVHFKQLHTYLKLTGKEIGLLINFNEVMVKNGLHRVLLKGVEGE
jgi:GxxExxY protein